MAGALETDPINQLQENLQCTVCLEPLKDPRTLPCFHSFCKDCLEDVVKTCRDKAPRGRPIRDIPCPYCREMFTLDPDKNVADMRRNHFICNMVNATAVLNQDIKIGVPCSHECSQSYSVARCVTCEKFLCQECLAIHNSYRGHAGHSVLTMEELSKPENRKKIKDKIYCNEHHGKKLKVYCETCDQLICKDCMDFRHIKQNHSCFLVKDVVNNYKELLISNNEAMVGVLNEGNAIVEQLTNTAEELDRDVKLTKTKIVKRKQSIVNKVVEMLNKHTETLLNEVDQLHKEKREVLDGQTKETKQYVDNVQRSVQLSNKLVEEGTEEEIISSQKMMLKSADNLLKKRQEYFEHVTVEKLKYTFSTKDEPSNEEISRMLARCLGIKDEGNHQVIDRDKSKVRRSKGRFLSSGICLSSTLTSYASSMKEDTTEIKYTKPGEDSKDSDKEECSICLCDFTDKKTLPKCGHSFCASCIDKAFKYEKKCPNCGQVYGALTGNQPPGQMFDSFQSTTLPGFKNCGTIVISYRFPSGTQAPNHPHPGKPYQGTTRTAYLPDNKEGRKVLKLLKKAFNQKLTFTVGRSTTTGRDDCVIWNDIHHKTNMIGGATGYGYPDRDYLRRVQEELAAKGITE